MKLCIEGIRSPLTIFSNGTKGYKVHQFSIAGKEHEMLYTCLEEVLMAQNAQWEDVEAIYCIE
jgi:hypothetical protein